MAAQFDSSQIRNVVLVGHGGCGKTSLAEAMLFLSGVTNRLGSTVNQTSILDFEPEEQKRQGTIGTSLAWTEHDGHKINILDTPDEESFSAIELDCCLIGSHALFLWCGLIWLLFSELLDASVSQS